MKNNIQKAIGVLNSGGIVIFPTDTAYGIGCRMDNEEAIKRLFQIRKRPETKSVPVLVNSVEMAQYYLQPIPKDVDKKLIKPHWPGGLTIILECREDKVSPLVRGGGKTLGVRIPNHPVPLELIAGTGVPLLAPSANFSGEKTPFSFSEVDPKLIELVDYTIEGQTNGQQSTVIDCSIISWKVLRQGAVSVKT